MTLCKWPFSFENRHVRCRFLEEGSDLHRVMCDFFEENRVFALKMLVFLEKMKGHVLILQKKKHMTYCFSRHTQSNWTQVMWSCAILKTLETDPTTREKHMTT